MAAQLTAYRDVIAGTVPANGWLTFQGVVQGPANSEEVTVVIDTGNAAGAVIDNAVAQAIGLRPLGMSTIFGIVPGASAPSALYPGFLVIPVSGYVRGSPAPIAVPSAHGDASQPGGQVNLGPSALRHAKLVMDGGRWWLAWNPGAVSPPSSPPTSPPTAPPSQPPARENYGGAPPAPPSQPAPQTPPYTPPPAGPGYLGVEVESHPADWTATGCEVYAVLAGSPATGILIGSSQRTDPVGDLIAEVTDVTQGWGPVPTPDCGTLARAMAATRPGDVVRLGYYHRQVFIIGRWEPETATVTLSQWPIGVGPGGNVL
ncbi:MAG: hypothetical protein K6U14_12045 [Firmicutes bacterium]|nr:hypothetical protein [Alicyclobacillaceae bacterium]MCL6498344.1 hypothetical protein [Bacillota bacterium]